VWSAGTPPTGTVCGMTSNDGEGAGSGNWCQGYNPTYGCPPGYTQYSFRVDFGNTYMMWCAAS